MKEKSMPCEDRLTVSIDGHLVGKLALSSNGYAAFEYDSSWLGMGFSISPLSLPLKSGVFIPRSLEPFEGLFGVFSDSLPDGWGRLLVDRVLRNHGYDPFSVSPLMRLAIVGSSGMGALCYEPEINYQDNMTGASLDELAKACSDILSGKDTENLDELFIKGGSSGGARPKINYEIDGEPWIVKFPSSMDDPDIGKQEFEYTACAKECGIEVEDIRLIPGQRGYGYFAVKRFDRKSGKRIHMLSASGLLETSHRLPNLDYHTLMKLTAMLTRDNDEIKQLYRRMCFNVFAHNRDDHSKNFTFLYDTEWQRWKLSPAYDLTYSHSIGGEHATTVDGNGSNPGISELLAVAKGAKLDQSWAKATAEDIRERVYESLGKWIKE